MHAIGSGSSHKASLPPPSKPLKTNFGFGFASVVDRALGGTEWRSFGERRLHLRQAAFARNRPAHPFLTKRLDLAEVVDPARRRYADQVFFGATVTLCDEQGKEQRYQIVGVDETDFARDESAEISPLARALLKSREGDLVRFQSPAGWREVESWFH